MRAFPYVVNVRCRALLAARCLPCVACIVGGPTDFRLTKFVGPLFPGDDFANVSPEDVHQGNLENCYFCAALALLASTDAGKAAIYDAILPTQYGFVVRFKAFTRNRCGSPQLDDVTVNVNRQFWTDFAAVDDEQPVYANTAVRGDVRSAIWPMVLEKAWAVRVAHELSHHSGAGRRSSNSTRRRNNYGRITASYDMLKPGNAQGFDDVESVVLGIAGWPYGTLDGLPGTGLSDLHVDELWESVRQPSKVAVVGTSLPHKQAHATLGLIGGHLYACLLYTSPSPRDRG